MSQKPNTTCAKVPSSTKVLYTFDVSSQKLFCFVFSFTNDNYLHSIIKVAIGKKFLHSILNLTQNLNFLFLSLCVYLFKNCPSQFLSQLSQCFSLFFLTKTKTKAWLSILGGTIQILQFILNYTQGSTFNKTEFYFLISNLANF